MEKFLETYTKDLDKFAPHKKKYSRGKNVPFINKTIKSVFLKEVVWKIIISKTVQITRKVHRTSKEYISCHF